MNHEHLKAEFFLSALVHFTYFSLATRCLVTTFKETDGPFGIQNVCYKHRVIYIERYEGDIFCPEAQMPSEVALKGMAHL